MTSHASVNIQIGILQTSQGPLDIIYDLQIEGQAIHLKDLMIYPRQPKPLRGVLRELLRARSEIYKFARELGFGKVRISGHRTLASSSANPGKDVDVIVNLRD